MWMDMNPNRNFQFKLVWPNMSRNLMGMSLLKLLWPKKAMNHMKMSLLC